MQKSNLIPKHNVAEKTDSVSARFFISHVSCSEQHSGTDAVGRKF